MKISTSFLGLKTIEDIKKLDSTSTDYMHVDIMDGTFVSNTNIYDVNLLKEIKKPLDIHLMVNDVYQYIDKYLELKPWGITFHLEINEDINQLINYIKQNNIKAGISLNPSTNINQLIPYLKDLDLILIMSVEPGLGGQEFKNSSIDKIDELIKIREKYNLSYLISIDGGINLNNIKKIASDMIVVGSYITNYNNYQDQIDKLKQI